MSASRPCENLTIRVIGDDPVARITPQVRLSWHKETHSQISTLRCYNRKTAEQYAIRKVENIKFSDFVKAAREMQSHFLKPAV
jgi:hypothetical protein